MKCHEHLSGGNRVDPRRWTDGQTDMMKLTVAFRKFAKAPKNCRLCLGTGLAPDNIAATVT